MALDWRDIDRWVIGEAWAGSQIGRHSAELCDRIGPRWGGSDGDRRAAAYIRAQMDANGLADPRVEQFTIHTWEHGRAEALVPGGGSSIKVLPFNRTPPMNVTGLLVDVGSGGAREISEAVRRVRPAGAGLRESQPLHGAVAVISLANEPFSPVVSLPDRLKLLAHAGAVACICVDRKSGGRVEYHSASDWRDPGLDEHPLPTVATPREDGALLRRLAAQGATLSLTVESRFFDAPAYNTHAQLTGSTWPDEHILLAGHHDTVHGSPGGNDNASGIIAVLETARVLAALSKATGVRPRRNLRFCTWSGEEQKLQGSAEYVRKHYAGPQFDWPASHGSAAPRAGHPEPVEGRAGRPGLVAARAGHPEPVEGRTGLETPPRFALNLDELSTGNVKGVVLNFPDSRDFIQRHLDGLGEGLKCHVLEYLDPWSDHFPFALAAIDSGFLWRWRFVGKHADSDYHHEPGDTADKINVRELKEYVGFLARLLLRLSHVPPDEWPPVPETPAGVQARLKSERPFVQRTM